ncbi:hypothetical protein [Alicycliphilus denitrificans]|uniref:hypothetical protein n=1 Tax=Alicycliphilus denitrificans TaxID=179636 RepID=UPI0001DA02DA|nr:hypothetical protein [Alicycliphilus denitrificans]ADV02224.1 hypothetical protein Alide_4624 [Alicycliphilus denitrificans BC]
MPNPLNVVMHFWNIQADEHNQWDSLGEDEKIDWAVKMANQGVVRSATPPEPSEYQHFLGKAKDALRGGRDAWAVQSTGEKVAVALVLNKPEWLQEMGYTLAEAIDRAGSQWVAMMAQIERDLRELSD